MEKELTLAEYVSRSKKLNNSFEKKIRVAVLGSYTLNGLSNTIQVKCDQHNVSCLTYDAGYNQYNQNILDDNSELYQFEPDIVFLLIDMRSILGDVFFSPYEISSSKRKEFIEKQASHIIDLINHFTKKSKSKFVVSNLNIPKYSPYGIFESKTEFGFQQMLHEFNRMLTENMEDNPSTYIFDFNGFVSKYGEVNVFDYRQFFTGDLKVSLNYIPYLAEELMGYIKPILGINRKCIVTDLDNTLWGGIVGEDGFDGIKLGLTAPGNAFVEFQRHLLSLNQRGIILAINSKNNLDDAMEVIKKHPYMILREENFAAMKINWDDKISNMQELAREINIGLDSIVFLDDDPFNREMLRKAMPEVMTIELPKDPALYSKTLFDINYFNVLKITEDDKKRAQMYRQQRQRNDFQQTTTNLDEYLENLGIKIKIREVDDFTIPRVSQLTLKTNQFNLTTRRYQEEDIKRFVNDDKFIVGHAQVEDKFGDNGITAAFIVNKTSPKEWTIDTFLLSCRVMGRGVEEAIIGNIIEKAREAGVEKVNGQYIPTKKNKPCEDFFSKCGFENSGKFWKFNTKKQFSIPSYLKIE